MSGSSSRTAIRLLACVVVLDCLLLGCGGNAADYQGSSSGPPQPSASSKSSGPTLFDLGRDFSFTANPNGPWRYGYTRDTTLTRAAFVPDAVAVAGSPVGFWHAGPGSAGYYPYIAASLGSTTVPDPTDSWAVRPGEVALEASATGQFAVIEFTVPRTGTYAIAADFAGIHKLLSTTDVHVLLDDESLFTATIAGYGGDLSFHPRQGASPTATYHAARVLRAGDVLTFAVGFGPNRTHYDDTTGLTVRITAVGR